MTLEHDSGACLEIAELITAFSSHGDRGQV